MPVAFSISGAKQNTQTKNFVRHPDVIFYLDGPMNLKKSALARSERKRSSTGDGDFFIKSWTTTFFFLVAQLATSL